MRKVTDFTKLPDEILIDLINADNGTQLKPGQLAFGTPSPMPEGARRNTELEVYAGVGSGFKGSVKIHYTRVPLSFKINGDLEFEIGDARQIRDLIPAINARYGIQLTSDDYVDAPLTKPLFGSPLTFVLQATPQCLVYIGQIELTTVNSVNEGIPLSMVIRDIYLNTIDPVPADTCPADCCTTP